MLNGNKRIILFGLEVVSMRLLLEGKNGNKDMILEDVKEYNESVHDRKIYVSYNDDKDNESYSMIQYMAVPEDFSNEQRTANILKYMSGEKKIDIK